MTKKDYQAIARVIHGALVKEYDGNGQAREIIQGLSGYFQEDNPRFDHARFETACLTGKCRGMKQ